MNPLNVFNNPKLPLKYPSNWGKRITMFMRSFKYAYQRATKGFADCDLWDFDSYLLYILSHGLEAFANTTIGYPGNKEFPTYESWSRYVREMAMHFLKAQESNDYFLHPKEDEWWAEVQKTKGEVDETIVSAMIEEAKENQDKREAQLTLGLYKLQHVFFHLWD